MPVPLELLKSGYPGDRFQASSTTAEALELVPSAASITHVAAAGMARGPGAWGPGVLWIYFSLMYVLGEIERRLYYIFIVEGCPLGVSYGGVRGFCCAGSIEGGRVGIITPRQARGFIAIGFFFGRFKSSSERKMEK